MENNNAKYILALENAVDGVKAAINSPSRVAELYAHLDDEKQALFWQDVALEFKNFEGGSSRGCLQNCYIAKLLSEEAKDYIKNLHSHILLNEDQGANQHD